MTGRKEAEYYYERETFREFFIRLLQRVLTVMILAICAVSVVVLIQGEREIKNLEEELGISYPLTVYEGIPYERISVEQMVRNDIKALPVPKMEMEEIHQKVEETKLYTEEEVELLARLMYAEEGIFIYKLSEEEAKYICQLAGSVVIHRKNMNYGGAETIEEVIYADGQYQSVENGSIYQEVPDVVFEWAEELLKDGPIGPENMVFQAEFEQGTETYAHIENQYFCLK